MKDQAYGTLLHVKKSPFLVQLQLVIPPKYQVFQLPQCLPYSRCNIESSHVVYSYGYLSNHLAFHLCFAGLSLILGSVQQNRLE